MQILHKLFLYKFLLITAVFHSNSQLFSIRLLSSFQSSLCCCILDSFHSTLRFSLFPALVWATCCLLFFGCVHTISINMFYRIQNRILWIHFSSNHMFWDLFSLIFLWDKWFSRQWQFWWCSLGLWCRVDYQQVHMVP